MKITDVTLPFRVWQESEACMTATAEVLALPSTGCGRIMFGLRSAAASDV